MRLAPESRRTVEPCEFPFPRFLLLTFVCCERCRGSARFVCGLVCGLEVDRFEGLTLEGSLRVLEDWLCLAFPELLFLPLL